jgi:hypothetical protein
VSEGAGVGVTELTEVRRAGVGVSELAGSWRVSDRELRVSDRELAWE